ncbi:MAG: hypothetical protein A2Z44_07565 [Betaproteobacteria bacterium RBG_19FT_COMBO_58_11]|nr:MAG: hypothetical protein A2Z44_07565 [Betaproteobacteria bacterium RBG_19FT_COMBO_58_11]
MNGKKTVLSLALGSAFAVTLVAAPLATATENPFGMSALKSGYLLAAADEAKPAAKPMEGKCGGMKDEKAKDGKCGGMKDAKAKNAKKAAKAKDGKCGEGKCGGKKADDKAAAPAAGDKK